MASLVVSIATRSLPALNVPTNMTSLCVLADVDEAAGAGEAWGPNLLTFRLPSRVDLSKAEEGHVKSATIVKVELIGLIDDRLGVRGSAKIQARLPACRR